TLNAYFDDLYDAEILQKDTADFFKLQYHIANPSPDPVNEQNPADPAARSLYYGINLPPAAVMDGILGNYYSTTFDGNYQKITPREIDRRSLEDPLFDIQISNIDGGLSADSLKFDVEFTYIHPTQAFSNPVTFHVVLLEDRVDGSSIHRNVVRKFLLSTEGKTVNIPWVFNQTETIKVATSIDVPIGNDNDKLYLAAFVQERRIGSKVIHQATITKAPERSGKTITGTDDPVFAQIKDMAVYPNPTTRYINFATDAALTRDYQYTIVDQRGITILSGNLNRDLTVPQQVDLSNIADGVYMVMIHQNGRRLIQRKLAVLKR
ncbi:MAG TPA: T9SS type A sorting domain-containing protein, partial [Cyclobacteriaceae bacterium]|nr:T9SS type A sorting domain-containing protein [Cyclobacteriaceae bacterium]